MVYTVNKLAKTSGVSTRTLRFYDQIDLLKPAFYGDNRYRYYKEEQLLILQQILFFRELGFPLNDIQQILSSNDFDKIESLKTHRAAIEARVEVSKKLLKTIDTTISHLRGKLIMSDIEMYDGFDPKKQQEHEKYMLEMGVISQQQIDESWEKVSDWKKSNWEAFKEEGEVLNQALAQAMVAQHQPQSEVMQGLVQKHYDWVKHFWTPTKETYLGLGQMYLDHPDYRTFYDRYNPGLTEHLVEAMKYFAELQLD